MSISAISNSSAASLLQRVFQKADPSLPSTQSLPGTGQSSTIAAKTTGGGGAQIASNSLSALLSLQTDGSAQGVKHGGGHGGGAKGAADLASKLIDALDANGDGTVSAEEAAAALSQNGDASDISKAFASLDADGDGQINKDELTAGLEAAKPNGPPGGPPSASGQAASILSAFNTDGEDGLSLKELMSALKNDSSESSDETSKRFAALDANKDGVLSLDELTKGLQAQFDAATSAYTQTQSLTEAAA